MIYKKLNKFDKTKDLTWFRLGNFSQPITRSSVIMSANEKAEFEALENVIKHNGTIRALTQTESTIYIVEKE